MTVRAGRARKILIGLAGGLAALFVLAQFIRPARTNPPVDPQRTLAARLDPPAEVLAVIDRACRDCHSSETRWPWYSNVAPVSWWLADHVKHARRHMDFSDWARLEPAEESHHLKEICDMVREGLMPLRSYLLMHRDARLSEQDVERLCGWSASARSRLEEQARGGEAPGGGLASGHEGHDHER